MKILVLLRRDLARSRGRMMMVGSAVAVGVAVVVLFGALGVGLYQNVVSPLLPRLPLDLIRVEPRVLSLGMLAFDAGNVGSGGLDQRAVDCLGGISGVAAAYPMVGAAFPLRAEGGARFLGVTMRTDLFATGLAPALVAKDVAQGFKFEDPGPDGKVVPILVARRLLDLYNTTVAPAIQKPKLSAEAVLGFSFDLVLGSSYVLGTPDPNQVEQRVAQIVGFSDQATLIGITVPEATMRRWNTLHGGGKMPIVAAYVKTKDPREAGPVAGAIEKAGFAVDDSLKIVGAVVAGTGALSALFLSVLLGLAGFAIAQTFFLLIAERRSELAVLRAMGARRRDLRRLVLAEALVVGAGGGLFGLLLGVGASLGAEAIALRLLPEIPFKPEHVVAFPPPLLLGALLLGVLAALVGAWLPAARAAAQEPAVALRE